MTSAYRRTGADPPLGDPRRYHGVPMEGYYWRLTDVAAGRVVVALCGLLRRPGGAVDALIALAEHPGGRMRSVTVAGARAAADGMGIDAGVLRAREDRLTVDLGPGARLDVSLERRRPWPRPVLGGLGVAGALPGMSQYWHPHLLGARVVGTAEIGDERLGLTGATAYAEKNWGGGFPSRWWWGQAQGFADDACIAFAGGRLEVGPVAVPATSLVIRLEDRLLRLVAPGALVSARVDGTAWRVRARSPRYVATLEGEASPTPAPLPVAGAPAGVVDHHLGGRLWVALRAGRRTLWRGESVLAGLEDGRREGDGR